jgi:thymidylate synthase
MNQLTCKDIRSEFLRLLGEGKFVKDKSGTDLIEIVGASFIADEDFIFGAVNDDYVKREIAWYESYSLNVNDIPPPVPKIWLQVATPGGRINSNYGYLTGSLENGNQYGNCLLQLLTDASSRRAIMIYTRPSIQVEYNKDGMSDFICTNAVQYLIRDGKLHAFVSMRSNDAIFGFRNDLQWQKYILDKLVKDYNLCVNSNHVTTGDIYWNATSLHVYARHFPLVK